MHLGVLVSAPCLWWAMCLHSSLFCASRFPFGFSEYYNGILDVRMSVRPPLHVHFGLSINPNLCRYALVFPSPVTIAVNVAVIGILTCSLCYTSGRNDLHRVPFPVLSHCLCHLAIPCFFNSVATVFIGIL